MRFMATELGYALLVNPSDIETPVEDLRVEVHVVLDHYSQDPFEVIAKARRIPDRHIAKGHAYLIGAGTLEL